MISKLDKKALPDILLMDIDMPDMDGFEAVAWLRKHFPQIAILVISMVETEEAVVRMLRMGVKGYLSKDIEVEDIYQALKAIATDGHYYTDFLTGKLIGSLQTDGNQQEATEKNTLPAWQRLNESERKFLTLACTTDLPYEDIAGRMFLSIKTVEGYRRHIFAEFNVKNRIGMMLYAIRNHLVDVIPDQPAQ
jgi:DNA-binding NarL/FixJ family response regulator